MGEGCEAGLVPAPVLYAVVDGAGAISAMSEAAPSGQRRTALRDLVPRCDRDEIDRALASPSASQLRTALTYLPGSPAVCVDISGLMRGAHGAVRVVVAHDLGALMLREELVADRYGIDPVTGLLARSLLLARFPRFAAAARHAPGPVCAAVFADVDGLKQVNDRYGHAAGDAVLAAFGETLRGLVRPGDLAARVGGDELVVLLAGLPSAASIDAVVHRVQAAMVTRRGVPAGAPAVTCSVGATDLGPDEDLERVLARADAAMYLVKRSRPGAVPRDVRQAGAAPVRVGEERPVTPSGSALQAGCDPVEHQLQVVVEERHAGT